MYKHRHPGKMRRYSKDDWNRKTVREREVRRRKSTSRQFDEPLRIFIETKYKDIFQEYNDLYTRMLEDCSAKKDLTKTKTFKEWLKVNGETVQMPRGGGERRLTVSTAADSLQNNERVQDDEAEQMSCEQVAESDDESDGELEQRSAVLGQALRDILDQEVVDMTSSDFHLNVEMVAEILDELQEDRDLRDVLEGANEDEGVVLNYFDDVEMDIQPFNHTLEVETNNF